MKNFDAIYTTYVTEDEGPIQVPGSTNARLKSVLDKIAVTSPNTLAETLFDLLTEPDTEGILNDFHRQILSTPE
jgi:hypothetical protein